jgi:hypothetical protein
MAANDPNFGGVKLLLHCDGADNGTTFTDVTGKTVTRNGSTVTKTATKKYGTASAYFDGDGDYLSLAASSDFDLSSGDFTVEFWVYAVSGSKRTIGTRSGAPAIGWIISVNPGTVVTWYQWTAGNTANSATGPAPAASTWTHIAVCRVGDVVTVYVDGSSSGGTPLNSTNRPASNNVLNIGRDQSAPTTEQFAGYLDDIRITKGAARYTGTFTPPTAAHPNYGRYLAGTITEDTDHTDFIVRAHRLDTGALIAEVASTGGAYELPCTISNVDYSGPVMLSAYQKLGTAWAANTAYASNAYVFPPDPVTDPHVFVASSVDPTPVLLLHCDGADNGTTFTDVTGKTVTRANAVTKTATKKYGTASAYFDGTGDYLSVPTSTDFDFGAGDFAVECWVYQTSRPGIQSLIARWASTAGNNFSWRLLIQADGTPAFQYGYGSYSVGATATATAAISLNTWTHVAVACASGTIKIFLDGVVVETHTRLGTLTTSTAAVNIARHEEADAWYLIGYLDDIRVTKGAARYTADFTPPTAAFPYGTGATEPTWDTTPGNTTSDGSVTWTCQGRMIQPILQGPLIPSI